MRTLLIPAVSLLSRIKNSHKFTVIGLFILLPIGLMMTVLIMQAEQKVVLVKKELAAHEYGYRLQSIRYDLHQYRMHLSPSSASSVWSNVNQNEISERLAVHVDQWNVLHTEYGDSIAAVHWESVRERLNDLFFDVAQYRSTEERAERTAIILQQIGELQGQLQQDYTYVTSTNEQTRELKQFIRASSFLFAAFEHVALGRTAIDSIHSFSFEHIQSLVHRWDESTRPQIPAALSASIDHSAMELHPDEQVALALEMTNRLHEFASNELIQILRDQWTQIKFERNVLIILLTVMLAWMTYLWSALQSSIVKPVTLLNDAARSVLNGDRSFDYDVHTSEDLYPVADALQKMTHMNDDLNDRRKRYEQELHYFANHDPLTDLPNRYVFNQRLLETIEEASRNESKIAILFLDLDRFKVVNDTLGHDAGDYILKTIADRISSCLGQHDTVSRMGGDEFLIYLRNINHVDKAKRIAQHILSILMEPIRMNGRELVVTASIGISVYPDDGGDMKSLVTQANTALYAAKERGRNTYAHYEQIVNSGSDERLLIEMHLRTALDHDELELYYQPRVNSMTDAITGMEALIRWHNSELGSVSPAKFIPIAEETGAIIPIGEWVLRTACEQCKKWHDAGFPLQISVNISAVQFQRQDFVEILQEALSDAELEPQYLEIELTESLVMKDVEQTIAILEKVKEIGIQVSIDDFGTGFSSLNYLKLLPIDTLKIDQSFIQNTPDDTKDSAITKTIIALARRLELKTVAEGVETFQQRNFLKSRKCSELQGYFISKPLPSQFILPFIQKTEAGT